MNFEGEAADARKSIDLNTPESLGGLTAEENYQYHNILGISGDVLKPEQVAEIDAAVSGLTVDQQKRVKEIVGAWLHTHHGMGLPNVKEIAKALKNGSLI